ncbi:CRTAC1 family protein [candidate division KSB1 bacterium]|nr:CRTAC1 family protein [candidate division KSB1 bacterium]
MGSGCAFFDYDNDGDLDIYLVNGAPLPGYSAKETPTNMLYQNQGDGRFTDVTKQAGVGDTGYGIGCAVADYNNDGFVDIFLTNFGTNVLYRNNGDGTFSDVTLAARVDDDNWSASAAFLDYDNDGDLDLYVVNYVNFTIKNHIKCGQGSRGIRAYCHPNAYDGVADILYRNNGDGTFSDVTMKAGIYNPSGKGLGVVCGDIDNDGDQDIYVANDKTPNFLFRNNGDGTFSEMGLQSGVGYNEDGVSEAGMGVDLGDYDGDGYLDIFVTNFSNETNTLYQNQRSGFFRDMTYVSGLGISSLLSLGFGTNFFDFDLDGDLDIYVTNGHVLDNVELFKDNITYAQPDQLFGNNGQGFFTDVSEKLGRDFQIAKVGRGAAFGDYDNDGDIDVLISNNNQTANLFRNDSGNHNNWLKIKTVGTKSNRDGIGARVKVVSGSLVQIEEVRSAGSYLSANDLRLTFGLEKLNKIDSVEIRWPSGLTESYRDLPVNHLLILKEGASYQLQRLNSF